MRDVPLGRAHRKFIQFEEYPIKYDSLECFAVHEMCRLPQCSCVLFSVRHGVLDSIERPPHQMANGFRISPGGCCDVGHTKLAGLLE